MTLCWVGSVKQGGWSRPVRTGHHLTTNPGETLTEESFKASFLKKGSGFETNRWPDLSSHQTSPAPFVLFYSSQKGAKGKIAIHIFGSHISDIIGVL